jgi:hypothetical protein
MKSPWKFLAQFIPQRRSAETSESSIGSDPDIERSQSEAQKSSGLPLDATENPPGSEHEESQPTEHVTGSTSDQFEAEWNAAPEVSMQNELEELDAPARRQNVGSTVQPHALRVASGAYKKSQRTPPTKKLERVKTPRADTIAQNADRAGDKSAQALRSREAFFDEVVDVD